MAVQNRYPSASADAGAVTLADLIELVTAAQRADLDPRRVIVRGEAIPFRMADLGADGGSVMRTLTLADWPRDLDPD